MEKNEIKKLCGIFEIYPAIKLVYLFGSRASGKVGPLSDYDFAFYLDEKDTQKRFDIRLELIGKISMALKTNDVDVCILNDIISPSLKYDIVKNGKIIFEKEPYKLLIEPSILNEYFDFHYSLVENNLTKTL